MNTIIAETVECMEKLPVNEGAAISAEIVEEDVISDNVEMGEAVRAVPLTPAAAGVTVGDKIKTIIESAQAAADKVAALVNLIRQGCEASSSLDLSKTKMTIDNGKVGLALKNLVKNELKAKWTDWVEENMTSLTVRTLENWMLLAKYEETDQYVWMGESRLLRIIRNQRKGKKKPTTPISDFLRSIGVDPNEGCNPELKKMIDDALTGVARKPKEPVSVAKLADNFQKSVDNFVKAIGEGVEGLDAERRVSWWQSSKNCWRSWLLDHNLKLASYPFTGLEASFGTRSIYSQK